MKKKQRTVLKQSLKLFTTTFCEKMNEYCKRLIVTDSSYINTLPTTFMSEKVGIECFYSEDRKHILILFTNMFKKFELRIAKGDVFNQIQVARSLRDANFPVGMTIQNANLKLKNIKFLNSSPFEITGDNVQLHFDNVEFGSEFTGNFLIEYGIVLSKQRFESLIGHETEYAKNIIIQYYNDVKKTSISDLLNPPRILSNEELKKEMERLFFSSDTSESEIDSFLKYNPIILEAALGLVKPMSQVTLVDQTDRFSNDLRPDLIALNLSTNRWSIIDYKKSISTLIKREGQTRESFKFEVTDLIGQLRDYREYFNDSLNRNYFFEQYEEIIEYPNAIGMIGNLSEENSSSFNRLCDDLPSWITIIPYNFIYRSFCNFIKHTENVNR